MYHVTESIHIDALMNEGLIPRIGERSLELGETVARVYLFSSVQTANEALLNWLGEWFEDKAEETGHEIELVILEINPEGLTLHPTFEGQDSWEWYSETPIPPTAISKIMSEEAFGKMAMNME
jgi:hypothetical protein